jgi:hypothetical protein
MSVCLSVRMEKLGSYWKDFREILRGSVTKYIEKFQVWLKLDNISSTLRVDPSMFFITSPQNLPKMKKVSDKNYKENKITNFMSTHFSKNRAVYKIITKKKRIEA